MRRSALFLYPVLPLLLIAACAGDPPAEEPAASPAGEAHVREVEQWRQERRAGLEKPDGWFSLVGLFWLEEGDNTCGSDPSNAVRLPDSAPASVGVLRRSGSTVAFEAGANNVAVTVDGQQVSRAELVTDAAGEPTVVEVGSIKLYLIDRGGRIGVRVKDSRSPALLAFSGLEYFPVDPKWRLAARFVPYDPPRKIAVPTVLGSIEEEPSPGAVEFQLAAGDHRLDVLPGGEGEYFIVFGDASNGKETYGGGRFLYAAAADAAGKVVLDFNRAYNPPCAFTPYATCPLPPRQNRLGVAVLAGEKKYAGGVPH